MKPVIQPDRDWYTNRSREDRIAPRCPFAAVEQCPRYYQSLSLLAGNGTTAMDNREDEVLRIKWSHHELWPKVDEDASGTYDGRGLQAHIFSNFCPEVTGERFGWFASSLARYTDERDADLAHRQLAENHADHNDYRWAWWWLGPMHYTECPLYAPLMKGLAMTDYWSMTDEELEKLAGKYNIPPLSRTGQYLEHWYVDRSRIIDELVRRDNALRAGKEPPAPSNVVNVQNMYASSIQQGSPGAVAKITFTMGDAKLGEVVEGLKNLCDNLGLPESAKQELSAEIGTLESQLRSPHPKLKIVTESLRSARTILEGAAANLIASGAVACIPALLQKITALLG